MVQVGLYGTTGTFPNLAKDAADVKYIFWPEPSYDYSFQKNVDYEDIPFLALPIAYDPFTQSRTITLKGTFSTSGAGDPPGSKTVKVRFEDLDKSTWRIATFDDQPEPANADEEVYCLEITFPDSSVKQHFCMLDSLTAKWSKGLGHLTFTAIFREISEIVLI